MPYQVRLDDGNMTSQGIVEILYNNKWRPLCDVNWGISESNVICRQLGYSTALTQSRRFEFGQGDLFILQFIWSCTGNESNIAECMISGKSNDCFAVGVTCQNVTSKFCVFIYLIRKPFKGTTLIAVNISKYNLFICTQKYFYVI